MHPKISCYTERSHLLALLAERYTAWFYTDPEEERGFQNVLQLTINGKQCSWHISDEDMPLFDPLNLMRYDNSPMWDGHTTEEKYANIRDAIGNYENMGEC